MDSNMEGRDNFLDLVLVLKINVCLISKILIYIDSILIIWLGKFVERNDQTTRNYS